MHLRTRRDMLVRKNLKMECMRLVRDCMSHCKEVSKKPCYSQKELRHQERAIE